ncbi:hypothetical protein F4803DRAFT_555298 [Xylaria telfairii]|nr:hypothetical protein F4803DRAFT_555298 [Xylaria telfairii]
MGLQVVAIVAYALLLHLLLPDVFGQQLATVKCVTLAGGCDAGGVHAGVLQKAISQFYINTTYGGRDGETIVYSATQDGGALAQISYSCKSGSSPPPIEGYDVRQRLQLVGDCANSCGSISVDSDCGFGVLIIKQDPNPSQSCWLKGLQVKPTGTSITKTPSDKSLLEINNANKATDTRHLHARASTSRDEIYSELRRQTGTHLRNTENTVEVFEMYSLRGIQTAEESLPLLRNLEGDEAQLVARLGTTSSTSLMAGTELVRGTAIGTITFTNILGAAGAFASALGFLGAAVRGGGGGGDPDPGDGEGGGNDNGNGQGNGGNGKLEIPQPVLDMETLDQGLDASLMARNILETRWENRRPANNSFSPEGVNVPRVNVCFNDDVTFWQAEEYPSTRQWPDSDNDDTSTPNLPGIGEIPSLSGSGPYNGPSVNYFMNYDTDMPFCIPHLARSPGVRNQFWALFDTDPPPAIKYATPLYSDAIPFKLTFHEHVFELHIVKDFVNWLTTNRGIACQTISNANLQGIPNSDVNFLDRVMMELSWYKSYANGLEYSCRKRLSEFFVLESHLNQCKTKIMNYRPLGESEANNHILPRPTSLNECDEYLDMYGMTADYFNARPVMLAFMYARKRVYDYLTRVHTNPHISNINSNGVPVNELWVQFTDAWVVKRNNDFQA